MPLTNYIEKLAHVEGPVSNILDEWQIIQPNQTFELKSIPVFCALNERELLILGGYDQAVVP